MTNVVGRRADYCVAALPRAAAALASPTVNPATPLVPDPRHLANGRSIPAGYYADQPFVVRTDDGAWLNVVTTGVAHEGSSGQSVVSRRSPDRGLSWSEGVPLEPAGSPENSYAVLLKVPGGRIYVFYNYNIDNVRTIPANDPPYPGGRCQRVDSTGAFVCRWSDDHGRSWSVQRVVLPVREFVIDRENHAPRGMRFFWNVGKPFIHGGAVYVTVHKVGPIGDDFFTRSEGVWLRSADLLTVASPTTAEWETLPEGEIGLRTPPGGGPIAEEHCTVVLADDTFYAVYRSVAGHPVNATSRDGGRTWSEPRYLTYAHGRLVKHPRAANFVWPCGGGRYLYWFHNHGGRNYDDRNPAWVCSGVEIATPAGRSIAWGEPEILLYVDDPLVRMSYPDLLIEDDGRYYVTETQKHYARVHELPAALLDALWQRTSRRELRRANLVRTHHDPKALGGELPMPPLKTFLDRDWGSPHYGTQDLRTGFSLELWLQAGTTGALLDNRLPDGRGLMLHATADGGIVLTLSDGCTEARWGSEPGRVIGQAAHHVVVIVDGGPKIISAVIDGVFCDGGTHRQFGWGRFSPNLQNAHGAAELRVGGGVSTLRIYDAAIYTADAVAHFRLGNVMV